jgi:hypothetical protein
MSEEKHVPYIKRLENQRDACIKAMKAMEAYEAALARASNTVYKADALKYATKLGNEMTTAISEAKKLLGGSYE